MKQISRMLNKKMKRNLILITVGLLVIVVLIVALRFNVQRKEPPEILTTSNLKEIINISELSTHKAVYKGIAQVYHPKKVEKIDYYVAYEAEVYANINLEEVNIVMDHENYLISISLPEIELADPIIDISSLDYMFVREKANQSGITENAYKACIEDALTECAAEESIYELAEQGVMNTITALIEPLIEQSDVQYEIQFL